MIFTQNTWRINKYYAICLFTGQHVQNQFKFKSIKMLHQIFQNQNDHFLMEELNQQRILKFKIINQMLDRELKHEKEKEKIHSMLAFQDKTFQNNQLKMNNRKCQAQQQKNLTLNKENRNDNVEQFLIEKNENIEHKAKQFYLQPKKQYSSSSAQEDSTEYFNIMLLKQKEKQKLKERSYSQKLLKKKSNPVLNRTLNQKYGKSLKKQKQIKYMTKNKVQEKINHQPILNERSTIIKKQTRFRSQSARQLKDKILKKILVPYGQQSILKDPRLQKNQHKKKIKCPYEQSYTKKNNKSKTKMGKKCSLAYQQMIQSKIQKQRAQLLLTQVQKYKSKVNFLQFQVQKLKQIQKQLQQVQKDYTKSQNLRKQQKHLIEKLKNNNEIKAKKIL